MGMRCLWGLIGLINVLVRRLAFADSFGVEVIERVAALVNAKLKNGLSIKKVFVRIFAIKSDGLGRPGRTDRCQDGRD